MRQNLFIFIKIFPILLPVIRIQPRMSLFYSLDMLKPFEEFSVVQFSSFLYTEVWHEFVKLLFRQQEHKRVQDPPELWSGYQAIAVIVDLLERCT